MDEGPDRESRVLERAAEILADEPTDDEIAEHEERARRNRIERIMALAPADPPPPPVVHKVRENARVEPVTDAPSTQDERVLWWARRCDELMFSLRHMQPRGVAAILLRELAAVSISGARQRERIEHRVAALEAAHPKPRIRVAAGRMPI